jgi:hypothetical protein
MQIKTLQEYKNIYTYKNVKRDHATNQQQKINMKIQQHSQKSTEKLINAKKGNKPTTHFTDYDQPFHIAPRQYPSRIHQSQT